MPTETKHTPGPWYAVEYGGYVNIQSGEHYGATNLLDMEECSRVEANGKLSAHSPEMYELLEAILEENPSPQQIRQKAFEIKNKIDN